jgi:hypothetical protein
MAAGLSEPVARLLKKPAVAAGFFMPETKPSGLTQSL